jgi:hypothetical protein
MPADDTEKAMTARFGSRIDGTIPCDDLAYFISIAAHQRIEPRQLARMPQLERAILFAKAGSFQGRVFEPLDRYFVVSTQAMAIRLLELGLLC